MHACMPAVFSANRRGQQTSKTLQTLSSIFPDRVLDFLKDQSVLGFLKLKIVIEKVLEKGKLFPKISQKENVVRGYIINEHCGLKS